jgi:hypothetical protein
MRRAVATLALALAISAPAAADGQKIVVTKQAWGWYQEYLKMIGTTKHGVFSITSDGGGAGSWICMEIRCTDIGQFRSKAIKECKRYNPSSECIVFAIDDEIKVDYEIAP